MGRQLKDYVSKRRWQIVVLTLGLAMFFGLCLVSLTQAENPDIKSSKELNAPNPSQVMELLMVPDGSPTEKCLMPKDTPAKGECKGFFFVDENVLNNILQNYTECLGFESYFIDLSNQPLVELSDTLRIYGRTDEPLTIKGLRLAPSKDFPKNKPAVIVYGKPVILKDVDIKNFHEGIVFATEDNSKCRLVGGHIKSSAGATSAVAACSKTPVIEDTEINGFAQEVKLIRQ